MVNIEKEESGNPFEDDVYSGAEESSEESQEEESKDKVGSLVPSSANSEPSKPVVNKDAQRATRFLSVSSQNFLRSNSMRKDASPQMTAMLKEKLVELGRMTERVVKVEKLLCETLENMDYQQKQYEAKYRESFFNIYVVSQVRLFERNILHILVY